VKRKTWRYSMFMLEQGLSELSYAKAS
jgi:hypothetical protein